MNQTDNGEYEERYLFLIDILGFRSLVEQSIENSDTFERVKGAVRTVLTMGVQPKFTEDLAAGELVPVEIDIMDNPCGHCFSDHIVMTTAGTQQGLRKILYQMHYITGYLLELGIFPRGAITKGKIFDDFRVIFGPAIVEAHDLESKKAIYPRIVASTKIINDLEITHRYAHPRMKGNKLIEDFREDLDGFLFYDILRFKPTWGGRIKIVRQKEEGKPAIGEWEGIPTRTDWLYKVRDSIRAAMQVNSDEKVVQKYKWFKDYFNCSLRVDDQVKPL